MLSVCSNSYYRMRKGSSLRTTTGVNQQSFEGTHQLGWTASPQVCLKYLCRKGLQAEEMVVIQNIRGHEATLWPTRTEGRKGLCFFQGVKADRLESLSRRALFNHINVPSRLEPLEEFCVFQLHDPGSKFITGLAFCTFCPTNSLPGWYYFPLDQELSGLGNSFAKNFHLVECFHFTGQHHSTAASALLFIHQNHLWTDHVVQALLNIFVRCVK